ncbi:urease accessory protein UreD [Klenkia sp. LSe6-5]|uniref:Urease accessory protein UreD n=1 Tax=Klenkia sesuvii TaxID=3103137 RepID=A0ABU8DW38_9ACTN
MRTLVEVVARAGPGGRTVLPVVRSSGQLAVRRTGPTTVHLVATAFGPLGGDDAELRLVVEPGARLAVRTVAAAVVLPARGDSPPSAQRVHAEVGGALDLRFEPTVVTRGARHRALLHAQLDDGAELTATEQVQLGRVGEEPGRWTGTTRVERGGVPVLHTTVGLGPGAAAWSPPVAPRAYASTVHLGRSRDRATDTDAVRLPLDRGWVATAWGERLAPTLRRLALLEGAAPAEEAL